MSLSTWTTEQLLSLAQDHSLGSASQTTADAAKWLRLGRSEHGIWGEFANRSKPPQQTFIFLANNALLCNCPSRKYPCRHVLGLMLLYKEAPQVFNSQDHPSWLPSLAETSSIEIDAQTRRRTNEKQLQKARRIMHAYALWLQDLIHSGLAALPKQPPKFWSAMAQRLNDNGLHRLGWELRRLPGAAKMPKSLPAPAMGKASSKRRQLRIKKEEEPAPDWPLLALERLSHHYLISQGFANYDQLSSAAQADLGYAAGWLEEPPTAAAQIIEDDWVIAGGRFRFQQQVSIKETWLWGLQSQRYVHISRPFPRQDPTFTPFITGSIARAALDLIPGAWPFRARLRSIEDQWPQNERLPAHSSIKDAQKAYGRALSANPWLDIFPVALQEMTVQRLDEEWYIQDREGYGWPLPTQFLYGWHLTALLETEKTQLFGQWNGRTFTPLSFNDGGGLLAMHILTGVK